MVLEPQSIWSVYFNSNAASRATLITFTALMVLPTANCARD